MDVAPWVSVKFSCQAMSGFGGALHELQHGLVSIGVNRKNCPSMLCAALFGEHHPSVTHKWAWALDDGFLEGAGNALGFQLVPPLAFDHHLHVVVEAWWTGKSYPGKLGIHTLPCHMTTNRWPLCSWGL